MGILFLISTLQICSDPLSWSVAWLTPLLKQTLSTVTEDTEDTATWVTLDMAALSHMPTPLDPTSLTFQHVPYGYAASGVYRAANAGALHLAKRSADADADADAFYGYGGYGHLGYAGYGGPVAHAHSTGPHLPNVVQHVPYGYAASGVYRAANAGALHLAKRSADADAFYGYGGYGYAGP